MYVCMYVMHVVDVCMYVNCVCMYGTARMYVNMVVSMYVVYVMYVFCPLCMLSVFCTNEIHGMYVRDVCVYVCTLFMYVCMVCMRVCYAMICYVKDLCTLLCM